MLRHCEVDEKRLECEGIFAFAEVSQSWQFIREIFFVYRLYLAFFLPCLKSSG